MTSLRSICAAAALTVLMMAPTQGFSMATARISVAPPAGHASVPPIKLACISCSTNGGGNSR